MPYPQLVWPFQANATKPSGKTRAPFQHSPFSQEPRKSTPTKRIAGICGKSWRTCPSTKCKIIPTMVLQLWMILEFVIYLLKGFASKLRRAGTNWNSTKRVIGAKKYSSKHKKLILKKTTIRMSSKYEHQWAISEPVRPRNQWQHCRWWDLFPGEASTSPREPWQPQPHKLVICLHSLRMISLPKFPSILRFWRSQIPQLTP